MNLVGSEKFGKDYDTTCLYLHMEVEEVVV